jgi:ABC-2 type transport system ATP-binding protein
VIAIETTKLSKSYGSTLALEGLDLSVETGEMFGFLGPNGAGKTTTIRLLLDFIRPTRGNARIFGLDSRTDSFKIRKCISYLPGDMTLYGNMTGRQLITYLASLRGGVDWEYVAQITARLGADLDRSIRTLSRGNQQKIGLVQAFMCRPSLVIMDEPTSGLDPLIQQEFFQMVADVKNEGSTVFMSSHNIAEVERICDRVGIIRNGRLVAVESIESLKQQALHHLELQFASPVSMTDFARIPGIRNIWVDGNVLRCTVIGKPDQLLKAAAQFEVVRLRANEPSLEDVFLSFYDEQDNAVS